jgi:hypothetical protein
MKQTIAFNGKAIQPRKSLQTLSGMNQNKLFNHPNYKEADSSSSSESEDEEFDESSQSARS